MHLDAAPGDDTRHGDSCTGGSTGIGKGLIVLAVFALIVAVLTIPPSLLAVADEVIE